MHGNQRYRHAERGGFDQTVDYIVRIVMLFCICDRKNAAVQAQPAYTDQIRAENTRYVENRSQSGMENTPAQKRGATTRRQGLPPSRSSLRAVRSFSSKLISLGHRTASAAGKQNRRHRTQFAQQRSRNHIAQNIGGFEF